MTVPLPVDIDGTYPDSGTDASVKAHQQHHDGLHLAARPWAPSGFWVFPRYLDGATSTAWPIIGRAYTSVMDAPAGITALGINVTAAGAAGVVLRLGVFRDDAGKPGTVLEQGTVAGDSTGGKTLTLSSTYYGRLWLAGAPQGSGTPGSTWMTTAWGGPVSTSSAATWSPGGARSNVAYFAASGVFTDNPALTYESNPRHLCMAARLA